MTVTAILWLVGMGCLFASNWGLRRQIYRSHEPFMSAWRSARLNMAPWRMMLSVLGGGLLLLALWRMAF